MVAAAENSAITPGSGGSDDTARAVPHLDDGVVSEFLHRLPAKDAYRLTAVCARWSRLHDGLEGVHEAVVEDVQAWYFKRLFGHETPLDFAGGPRGRIVVNKDHFLLRYDLESGVMSLYRDDGNLGALYHRFHAFPLYRSG